MQPRPGIVVAVAAWLVAGAAMLLGGWLLGRKPDLVVMVLVSQAAVALPVLVLLTQLRPRDIGLGLPSARGWLGGVAVAPLAIACSLALGAAVYALVIALGGHDPGRQPVEEVIDTLHARLGLGGLVLCAAILPGVVEEALYRGVMLTGLRKHLSPAAAVLVCALLFAVMHLSPWRFLPQLALGCLLGWLTLRTGSCWPAALAHALHNAVLLVVTRLVQHHA